MKISVIIPCYNVEKYIDECINSILNQTIGLENFEIILVDDCSTDSTREILSKYEQKYPDNIMVVLCEKNGRQGTARNIGLSYSSGDYICFVDSDDFVHKDMLRTLYSVADKTDADIVQFRYCFKEEELEKGNNKIEINSWDYKLYIYDSIAKRKAYFNNYAVLNGSCTTKFYKRELLARAQVGFAEGVCYEEPLFTIPLKLYVEKVAVLEKYLYFYRSNNQGTTLCTMKRPETIADHIEVQFTTYCRLKNEVLYQQMKEEIDTYFLHAFFYEPFYFLASRKMYMSDELFNFLCATVREQLPEYKKVAVNLPPDEQQLVALIDKTIPDSGTRNIEIAKSLGQKGGINAAYLEMWQNDSKKLLSVVASGKEENAAGHIYRELFSLFHMCGMIKDGSDLYKKAYEMYINHAESVISRKMQAGEKVKLAFLPISAAQWPAEEVFRLFEKDIRFEVKVIPMPLMNHEKEDRDISYKEIYNYFESNGYPVVKVYNECSDEFLKWDDIGGIPDIIVHLTPWEDAIHDNYKIENCSSDTLHYYIPYGFSLIEGKGNDFTKKFVYNKDFMNVCAALYTDSSVNKEEYDKKQLLGGCNVKYSGYTKMDYFIDKGLPTEDEIKTVWKIPYGKKIDEIKRIIVAPHYSVGIKASDNSLALSTFDENYLFLLEMAQKYENKASFIFKPHPNLRLQSVRSGLFKNYEEYDKYINSWQQLPNAKVVNESDYLKIFSTSDAMIFDSGSFIAEYIYADKPALFLTKDDQNFNELGKNVIDAHSTCAGNDYVSIERFLINVIDGKDTKKEIRKEIYNKYLNYYDLNGRSASDYVYEDICGFF